MPTNKKESEVILRYVTENSQQQVVAANAAIRKAMQDMANAAKLSGKDAEQAYKKLGEEIDGLQSQLKSTANQFTIMGEKTPDDIKQALNQVKLLNEELKNTAPSVRDLDDEFSKVSKDVALAGDIESNLRTVGGTFGAIGGTKTQQTIGQVAEVPALIEALPRLKASLVGLPQAIGAAASALGPVGIGLGAVAIVAGVAISNLTSQIKAQADAARAAIDNDKEYYELLINGSKQTVQAKIDELQAENQVLLARQERLRQQREEAQAAEDAANGANVLKNTLDAFTTDAADVFTDELIAVGDEFNKNGIQILRLQGALRDNAFAAESAEEKIQRLNETLSAASNNAIKFAETRRQEILLASDLEQQSTEQLTARSAAIETEIKATSAAVAELQESGFQTEQVQQQIIAYNTTLRELEREQAFIKDTALDLAAARDAEAAAQEEQLKQQEEAEQLAKDRASAEKDYLDTVKKSLQDRAKLEKDHADELIKISQRAADEAQKALDGLNEKLADLNTGLGRDLTDLQRKQQQKVLEAQIEAQREQVDNLRDHVRTLEDIRRKADEDEIGLRKKRDFAGVVNLRQSARIQIQDEQREYARQEKDRIEDLARAANDRQIAFAEERADRLRKFQQDVIDARANYQRQRQEQAIANAQLITEARARHIQEINDLQQAAMQKLAIQRQTTGIEVNLLTILGNAAQNLLSQFAGFQAFASGNTTNISNATTNNNAGGITVNAQGQSSNVVGSILNVIQGIFS